MGCSSSKTPEDVGAMPNQPLDGEPNAIKKGARIVILGAGPAGLHMASRLKQLGCTNVTILERTFRYGGKTHTVHEHGNPNDIGTCWMHPGYGPVIELIRKYEVGPIAQPFGGVDARAAVDGEGRREGFSAWVLDEVEDVTLPEWMHSLMPDQLQQVPLAASRSG